MYPPVGDRLFDRDQGDRTALGTYEYLCEEGHTASLTEEEANILELCRRVYEELLAVRMVKDIKFEREKFAGTLCTARMNGFIPASG